jgi:hypothetical protein
LTLNGLQGVISQKMVFFDSSGSGEGSWVGSCEPSGFKDGGGGELLE